MKNTGFFSSLSYALKGLKIIIKEERNFRFDLLMAFLVVVCSLVFPLLKWEKCVVYALCALCLTTEAVNSAIEKMVDLASPDFHPLAGAAKDIGAAAALITAILSAVIGLYIFVPYGLDFLNNIS